MKPPGVKDSWDDCDVWTQALILAYEQLRDYEDTDFQLKLAGASPKPGRN